MYIILQIINYYNTKNLTYIRPLRKLRRKITQFILKT